MLEEKIQILPQPEKLDPNGKPLSLYEAIQKNVILKDRYNELNKAHLNRSSARKHAQDERSVMLKILKKNFDVNWKSINLEKYWTEAE